MFFSLFSSRYLQRSLYSLAHTWRCTLPSIYTRRMLHTNLLARSDAVTQLAHTTLTFSPLVLFLNFLSHLSTPVTVFLCHSPGSKQLRQLCCSADLFFHWCLLARGSTVRPPLLTRLELLLSDRNGSVAHMCRFSSVARSGVFRLPCESHCWASPLTSIDAFST